MKTPNQKFIHSIAQVTAVAFYLTLCGAMHGANPPFFQTIHAFGQVGPTTPIILSSDGHSFYGTTRNGGADGGATMFAINPKL